MSLKPALGRWDSRRVLKMFDLALVGSRFAQLSEEYKVTLATQTSLERLHSLVQVTGGEGIASVPQKDPKYQNITLSQNVSQNTRFNKALTRPHC